MLLYIQPRRIPPIQSSPISAFPPCPILQAQLGSYLVLISPNPTWSHPLHPNLIPSFQFNLAPSSQYNLCMSILAASPQSRLAPAHKQIQTRLPNPTLPYHSTGLSIQCSLALAPQSNLASSPNPLKQISSIQSDLAISPHWSVYPIQLGSGSPIQSGFIPTP